MRSKIFWISLPTLLLAATVAWGAVAPGAGILATKHDFTQGEFQATPAVGSCTFCHTPHKAQTQRLIWNHELSTQDYTWGTINKTIGGTQLPTISQTWTGPTKFCLSCHDGSVAFGSIYWFDKAQHLGASKMTLATTEDNMTFHTNHLIGSGGSMAGNHPVAVPYPYNNGTNVYNGATTGSQVVMSEFVADPSGSNIRLFNDTGAFVLAGAAAGTTGIECSSCHDVHNKASVDKYLLRGMLTGSGANYICLKCHNK